jgi:hypothetical protein
MGYACPVCSDPQADGGHLANHLAFTAMLGDEAHEAWLEEHAPGWADSGEAELADAVVDHVEETEFPQVFEDTAGGLDDDADPPQDRSGALFDDAHDAGHGHDHDTEQPTGGERAHTAGRGGEPGPVDEEAEAILAEAREMTRRMVAAPEDDAEASGGDGDADEETGGPADEAGGASEPAASTEGGADADNNG